MYFQVPSIKNTYRCGMWLKCCLLEKRGYRDLIMGIILKDVIRSLSSYMIRWHTSAPYVQVIFYEMYWYTIQICWLELQDNYFNLQHHYVDILQKKWQSYQHFFKSQNKPNIATKSLTVKGYFLKLFFTSLSKIEKNEQWISYPGLLIICSHTKWLAPFCQNAIFLDNILLIKLYAFILYSFTFSSFLQINAVLSCILNYFHLAKEGVIVNDL